MNTSQLYTEAAIEIRVMKQNVFTRLAVIPNPYRVAIEKRIVETELP